MAKLSAEELAAREAEGANLTPAQQERLHEAKVEERVAAQTGWFKSPSGYPSHADGATQKRSLLARGYTEITEGDAKALAGTVKTAQRDTSGTFDAPTG